MSMIDRNNISHLLGEMVKCRHCGTPMETVGGDSLNEAPRYVCTAKSDGCNTPDLEAEPFNSLVARRVILAFLDRENFREIFRIITDEAMSEGNEDIRTILDLEQPTPISDHQPNPHGREQARRVMDILSAEQTASTFWDSTGSTLYYAPATYRMVDEYSLNMDTYLRPSNIQITKTIMETLISEIQVGPNSATIQYRLPVHPGGRPEAGTSEEVATS